MSRLFQTGMRPPFTRCTFANIFSKCVHQLQALFQLQGGAVAKLPTDFPLSVCSGSDSRMTAAGAVCSYMQETPQGSGSYFWLAGP
jgi:hypothetical protein